MHVVQEVSSGSFFVCHCAKSHLLHIGLLGQDLLGLERQTYRHFFNLNNQLHNQPHFHTLSDHVSTQKVKTLQTDTQTVIHVTHVHV